MATHRFDIVNGPSREQLFDALRLIAEKRTVMVTWIRPDREREITNIVLNSLQAENGDGQSWNATGYDVDPGEGDMNLTFYIDTKSRTGWIQFCTGS